jgi:hypothetical protein
MTLGAVASEGAQALRAMIPNVVGEIKTVAEFNSMARDDRDYEPTLVSFRLLLHEQVVSHKSFLFGLTKFCVFR